MGARRSGRGVLVGVALATTIANASAATPPTITGFIANVHSGGDALFVGGSVTFTGEDPQVLGLDGQGDAGRPETGLFGMDLRAMSVWQPSVTDETLWFALSLWDFQAIAPGVAFHRWTFTIDGTPYRLEAALGGLFMDGSLDRVLPIGDETNLEGSFRFLGPCREPGRWPWEDAECPFASTVDGEFDLNADRVLWRVPMDGLFRPGAVIGPHPLGAEAEFRIGSTRYVDHAGQDRTGRNTYTISSARVLLGAAPTSAPDQIDYSTEALLAPDPSAMGSFTFQGTVDIRSLDHGPPGPNRDYDAVALACSATNCALPVRFGFTL